MKKIVLAAIVAAISVPAAAAPGDTDTTTGTANATIVAPITITHDVGAALNFGTMTAGGGGTVEVTTAGVGSATSDVVLLTGSVNSADSFTVDGDPNRTFDIEVVDGTIDNGGSDPMDFTVSASAATGTLDGTGTTTFTVGGILTVPADHPAGSYTGSYDATVTYN